MRRALVSMLSLATIFAGCGQEKDPVTEDFSDLAALDSKSDAFSYRMKLLGSLDYGQSADASYKNPPRFRAYKFAGAAGDEVDVWVRSTDGDAVAWVLDNSFHVVASNDDADASTLDAHVTATLPANTDPAIVTYYVVFREYHLHKSSFNVSLAKKNVDFFACKSDDQCVAVPAHVCCPNCQNAAVNKDQAEAYANQPLACSSPNICPKIACFLDTRVAQCNAVTSKCELVAVEDIQCGGFIRNAHQCPAGYQCKLPVSNPDLPGSCEKLPQTCGGIAGIACPAGQVCVDNPDDGCDPSAGGADCGGICQPAPSDCRSTGCASGSNCQICWGNWACVPDGAVC